MNTEQQMVPHIVPPKTVRSTEELDRFSAMMEHNPYTNDDTTRQLKDAYARNSEHKIDEPVLTNKESSQVSSHLGNTVRGDQVVMSALREIDKARQTPNNSPPADTQNLPKTMRR